MSIEALLDRIKQHPAAIDFNEVIAAIDAHYDYTPTRFSNGVEGDKVVNEAGRNEGSCRIFAFARLNGLTEAETLACFGRFYRDDVLHNPDGTDHANIRTFMRHGWGGIHFDGPALSEKLSDEQVRERLQQETARIPWAELQRHFASGKVIHVAPDLDLTDVALQFSRDNKAAVEGWINAGKIAFVSDAQARAWFADQATPLAVVVKPWVLVQG